jgi:hypothetical protein
MAGKVIRLSLITRKMVQESRGTTIYLFGDNMAREGLGGQAKDMRGEVNSLGIPTKWRPSNAPGAFFSDSDWDYIGVRISIKSAFDTARMYLTAGFNVVIPSDGIGTGRADLANKAPKIFQEISNEIHALERDFPNED